MLTIIEKRNYMFSQRSRLVIQLVKHGPKALILAILYLTYSFDMDASFTCSSLILNIRLQMGNIVRFKTDLLLFCEKVFSSNLRRVRFVKKSWVRFSKHLSLAIT